MAKTIGNVEETAVQEELLRIGREYGGLRAPDVVNEARPDEAVLHPAFEWDDAVAGEAFRKHQARNLIRAVKIETSDLKGRTFSVPAWTHVPATEEQESLYAPTIELVEQPDQFKLAVDDLIRKITDLERSVTCLQRLAEARNAGSFSQHAPAITDALSKVRDVLDSFPR
jgi:hypothetical protein